MTEFSDQPPQSTTRPEDTTPTGGEPPRDPFDGVREGAGDPFDALYGRGGDAPPDPGWDDVPPPGFGSGPGARPRLDFRPLFMLLDALRSGLPADLQARFTALVREALLTLRSLIDWYLERLDQRPGPEPQVEDIPIE